MTLTNTAEKPSTVEISKKETIANRDTSGEVLQQQRNGSSKQAGDEEAIRLRAYEIYANRGFQDGNHQADWLEAEEELYGPQ